MSMPLHYLEKREELDGILEYFKVSKCFYHRLLDLRKHLMYEIEVHCVEDNVKLMRALELIEEIMPKIQKKEELETI